jgi:hypothetical protein
MADAPSRGGQTGSFLSPTSVQVSYSGSYGQAQGQGASWFGPGKTMLPTAPPEVAGRQWDFEYSRNLLITPRAYERVSFQMLRALADGYDLMRLVIETRKDQVARMGWTIKPREKKGSTTLVKPITKFFEKPDGVHSWADWIRALLEDLFVIDAPTLYCQRDKLGRLLALNYMDGARILPVLDDWGRTPQPYMQDGKKIYPVAYQQNLKGLPAVDYSVRDMIYRPRNGRTNKAYGFSPVEQVITTINIGLQRQVSTLAYYTEGSSPEAMIGCPDTWTPQMISAYQREWDNRLAGEVERRRRVTFTPGELAKNYVAIKPNLLKDEFDDWLARVICFAFSTSPQPFIKQMNRASAETQKEISQEEGLEPVLDWIKALIDDVIANEFGAPDLEFGWAEDQEIDQAALSIIIQGNVAKGLMTINDGRGMLGLDRFANPAADMLMAWTATGYVPIEANTIDGKKANMDAFGVLPGAPPAPGEDEESDDEGEAGNMPPKPKNGKGSKTGSKGQGAASAKTGSVGAPKGGKASPKPGKMILDGDLAKAADPDGGGAEILPFDRSASRKAIKGMAAGLLKGFRKLAKTSAKTAKDALEDLGKANADRLSKYSEDQPRDDHGMWTGDGGSTWYHGSDVEIEGPLTTDKFGSGAFTEIDGTTKRGYAPAVYLTDSKEHAERYGNVSAYKLDESNATYHDAVPGLNEWAKDEGYESGQDMVDKYYEGDVYAATNADQMFNQQIRQAQSEGKGAAIIDFGNLVHGGRVALGKVAVVSNTKLIKPVASKGVSLAIDGGSAIVKAQPAKDDKSDSDIAQDIVDAIDFEALDATVETSAENMADIVKDAVDGAMAQIGVDKESELVDQVSEQAVKMARARAAELVGMRFNSDGELVANPRAEYAITDTTRDMIKQIITDGLADNIGSDAIVDNIQSATAFSADRAYAVAHNEIADANSRAALLAYKGARSHGVNVKKGWGLGPNPCEICQENADAGAIDLDDDFPSGDSEPTAHNHCECVLLPIVIRDKE